MLQGVKDSVRQGWVEDCPTKRSDLRRCKHTSADQISILAFPLCHVDSNRKKGGRSGALKPVTVYASHYSLTLKINNGLTLSLECNL